MVEYMQRLYITGYGLYVTVKDGELVVRRRSAIVHRQGLDNTVLIMLQGFRTAISASLAAEAAERDIPVIFSLPRGKPVAALTSVSTSRSHVRKQQILRLSDPDVVKTGLGMLAAKVGNQASVLKYFARYRKKTDAAIFTALSSAADKIRDMAQLLKTLDPCADNIRAVAMGYEGHAAALYWSNLARLVPGRFGFGGRVTRHAMDPVNQAVNYLYGILYGEIWCALVKVGLDPYFGLIHGSERNNSGLVFDFIEEFRAPFGDRLLVGMLGRGFEPDIGKDGYLRSGTCKQLASAFLKLWNKKIRWLNKKLSPAAIMEKQAVELVKVFTQNGGYRPFQFRW